MRSRLLGWLVIALVASACAGATCALQGYGPVTIETQLESDGSDGAFTLSGACGVCAEGGTVTNLDSGTEIRPDSSVEGEEYFFVDEMECADGSGSFVVRTHVPAAASAERTGSGEWELVRGTGDYEDFFGEGEYDAGTYSGEMGEQP